jgi:hypothetical protein
MPGNCPATHGPDSDFGQPPILLSLGAGKRALVIAQKSGMAYGLDPDAKGKLLWQTRVGKGGILGGSQWGSASDGARVALQNQRCGLLSMITLAIWREARFHGTANRRSAVPFHRTVASQSRSLKEVLGVTRFAVSTPVNDTVRCPEVSYPSSLKVPEYELPFGFN